MNDTHTDDERWEREFQNRVCDIFRGLSARQRVTMCAYLNSEVRDAIRHCLRNLFPDADDTQQRVKFVHACYGKELADRYAAHLALRASRGLT